MKTLRFISLILLIFPAIAYGDVLTRPEITGTTKNIWIQEGTTASPAGDVTEVDIPSFGDNTDFSTAEGWQSQVGRVSEMQGIHTHEFGLGACGATQRTPTSIRLASCTSHLHGTEYDFDTSVFTGFTNIPITLDSTFIGITINNYTTQDTFFTDSDLNDINPIARVQMALNGQLTIMDERNVISGIDKKDYRYRRGAIGPSTGLDNGIIPTETGTRNLNLSSGTLYSVEGDSHALPTYGLLSTIPLWRTTGAFDSWTTTGKDVFQLDNVSYNDVDNGGLLAAQNNNRYIYQLLACSPEGGVQDGVDTGRKPTCFSFYGPDQYISLEAARTSSIDLGSFAMSAPRLFIVAKIITKKNNATIVDIWDERRFITTPSGSSVSLPTTASLQTVYDNSPNGGIAEIITNATNGALTVSQGGDGVSDKGLEIEQSNGHDIFGVYTTHAEFGFSNGTSIQVDNDTTGGNTRFLLYDVDNGNLERVTVGAANSGGGGFKVLRIPN